MSALRAERAPEDAAILTRRGDVEVAAPERVGADRKLA